jgi:hypothetical protein
MAFVIADRVRETTTTTGTGTVSLLGAVTGFQSFSAGIGNSNSTYYTISNNVTNQWEVGIGTYTAVGSTLSRTTVLASSNSGSLVNFSTGTADVFVTYPSERAVYINSANTSVTVPALDTTGDIIMSGTGEIQVPAGTTAQRSGSPATGMFRYNSTLAQFEGYNGTIWGGIGGAQAGGAIQVNNATATVSYTIATGSNGFSVGPITLASGVSVTVASGQRWVVI